MTSAMIASPGQNAIHGASRRKSLARRAWRPMTGWRELTKSQKGQARLGENRNRHGRRRLHNRRRKHVRQHLSDQNGKMAEALVPGRGDVILKHDSQGNGPALIERRKSS